tara:strand:- start:28061 stop:28627 length:567 start_codon:yes stop_codon:yes gene_type:complete
MNGQINELWCWWCCHPIQGHTLHLPKKYIEETKKYEVYGNFCSFECMKSYNSNENGSFKQNQMMLISMMIQDMYGSEYHIIPAPPRECLKVFGGHMSIEDFRNKHENLYIKYNPPLTILPSNIEIQPLKNNHRWINPEDEDTKNKCYTLQEFEDSQTCKISNIPMRIKTVPKSNKNTLEKMMGLKSKT